MTKAEEEKLRKELLRLEDLQIKIYEDKKSGYARKNHDKIMKIRKILGEK